MGGLSPLSQVLSTNPHPTPNPSQPSWQKKNIFSPSFAGFYGGGKVLLVLRRNPTRPLHKVPASKSRDKTLIWDTGVGIGTNLVHTVYRKRVLGCAWCNKTKVKKKRAKHAVWKIGLPQFELVLFKQAWSLPLFFSVSWTNPCLRFEEERESGVCVCEEKFSDFPLLFPSSQPYLFLSPSSWGKADPYLPSKQ